MASTLRDALEAAASPRRVLGHRVVHVLETPSTMDDAWRFADAGEQEGVVVIADAQTAGRGRHGRRWSSQAGKDLLFSVLVRPRPAFAHELLILASVACANVTRWVTGRDISVKWPNDVLCDERKVAGILAESRQDSDGLVVVIGIGMNVNLDAREAEDLRNATSLAELSGRTQSRVEVLGGLLDEMDEMYTALRAGQTLIPEWRDSLETIGQHVEVASVDPRSPGLLVEGLAVDVDDQGRLVVQGEDGLLRAVAAGEVTLRRADEG